MPFPQNTPKLFIQYLKNLNYPFSAIEEPFEPYAISTMRKTAQSIQMPIILDESFMHIRDLDRLNGYHNFLPNIRVSKSGGSSENSGYYGVSQPENVPVILGSLVSETSILSILWLVVAGQYESKITSAEGAYSTHLLQEDITESPIIVTKPGVIYVFEPILTSPGLGIDKSPHIRKYLTSA